ncbi:MAG TPA: metallophosphoesterase family protein [Gaiellaceae bacterium]|nr:metallophosphoesterase family protein [Gaiellaceae bacterium]
MRRHIITTAAVALLCVALALAGSVIALRAAAPESRVVTLGTVDVHVVPARQGALDVYVPVVDWGVRARPFRAPVEVELEFRSLDRDAALAALRTGGSADASLALLETELRDVVSAGLRRAALFGLLGGAVGGLLAGSIAAAAGRRSWLVLGPAVGLAASFAAVALTGMGVSRFDYDALREPTFYANGDELPRLLAFSERVLASTDGYDDTYGEAVAGLTRLVAAADQYGREPATIDRSLVVASDLHSNGLVLPGLEGFTSGKPVFVVGDLTQRGTRYEEAIVPGLARLGEPVVAVSGNHDSRELMLAAARAGIVVLTRNGRLLEDGTTDGEPVHSLAGLRVAGFDDPLETAGGTFAGQLLELKEQTFADASRQLVDWFFSLPERPQIVLVHRHGLAHALLDRLEAEAGAPVLIMTGHDHDQHVDTAGPYVLVNGGSVGAGGIFGVGEEDSGFAVVHVDAGGEPRSVDLVSVEPASGAARAERLVLAPRPEDAVVSGEAGS